MRRNERVALRSAFEPPAPQGKHAFLRQLPRKRRSIGNLLWSQLRYIHVLSWGCSLLVLAAALYVGQAGQEISLWWLSSLTPFLSMALVTELSRSAAHGMEELELATRYSLRTVILGRLVLLGLFDLTVLALLLAWLPSPGGGLRLGLHLLLPYLASALLSLRLVRRSRGKEGYVLALAAACLVGSAAWAVENWVRFPVSWWLAVALVLLVRTVREFEALLKRSEEYVWNY